MTPDNNQANDRYNPPGNLSEDFEKYKFSELEINELFWQTNQPGDNIPWRKVSATQGRNLKAQSDHNFNPNTVIPYSLEDDVDVKISVYDMLGTLVYDFKGGRQYAGNRSVEWNATNNSGQQVPAGIYFYKLNAGEQVMTKKMILLK